MTNTSTITPTKQSQQPDIKPLKRYSNPLQDPFNILDLINNRPKPGK